MTRYSTRRGRSKKLAFLLVALSAIGIAIAAGTGGWGHGHGHDGWSWGGKSYTYDNDRQSNWSNIGVESNLTNVIDLSDNLDIGDSRFSWGSDVIYKTSDRIGVWANQGGTIDNDVSVYQRNTEEDDCGCLGGWPRHGKSYTYDNDRQSNRSNVGVSSDLTNVIDVSDNVDIDGSNFSWGSDVIYYGSDNISVDSSQWGKIDTDVGVTQWNSGD